jgi:hypothetical protein
MNKFTESQSEAPLGEDTGLVFSVPLLEGSVAGEILALAVKVAQQNANIQRLAGP